jgi:5'-methylthioadenosine phosphorylase
MIIQTLLANVEIAKQAVKAAIHKIPERREECYCPRALKKAIATHRTRIPEATRRKLDLLIGKYLT